MTEGKEPDLRSLLDDHVLKDIADNFSLSNLKAALESSLYEVALADFRATSKVKFLVRWWDLFGEAYNHVPDVVFDTLLKETFEELLNATDRKMEACLEYENSTVGVSVANAGTFSAAIEAIRLVRSVKPDQNQTIIAMLMFLIGGYSITLELPILKSMLITETRTGTSVAWHSEVEKMCMKAETKDFDTILNIIDVNASAEHPVFTAVEREDERIYWKTKTKHTIKSDSRKEASFAFSTLRQFLYRLKL